MPFLRQTSEGVILIELLQQRVQNQVTDNLGSDKVNGAGGRFLAVGSADVVVLRGLVVCVPIAALVIHFRTALAAVEQPGQRIWLSIAVAAPDRPAELRRVLCAFGRDIRSISVTGSYRTVHKIFRTNLLHISSDSDII